MFTPPVKSVVAQMAFMSPAISRVPWVDNDLFFVFDNTELIPASFDALDDMSLAFDWAISPPVADSMAPTSAADLSITDMFRSLKSWIWSDAWVKARSRDCISPSFDEQMQRRYLSFTVAQN